MDVSEMKIGVLVPIWTDSLAGKTPTLKQSLAFACHAEEVGLDSVWLTDHLYWETFIDFRAMGIEPPAELEGVKAGQWECWTTAAAIAVQTKNIEIGTLVSNTTFRNPALLARTAETFYNEAFFPFFSIIFPAVPSSMATFQSIIAETKR